MNNSHTRLVSILLVAVAGAGLLAGCSGQDLSNLDDYAGSFDERAGEVCRVDGDLADMSPAETSLELTGARDATVGDARALVASDDDRTTEFEMSTVSELGDDEYLALCYLESDTPATSGGFSQAILGQTEGDRGSTWVIYK